jgi:hypothetical protein
MLRIALAGIAVLAYAALSAQMPIDMLKSEFTLQQERDKLKSSLHSRTIRENLSAPLTPDNEYKYQSAFWSIAQFLIDDKAVQEGFLKTANAYPQLEYETKRAFLEALYAINPLTFQQYAKAWLPVEQHPKLFAMAALFVHRNDPSTGAFILKELNRRWPAFGEIPILAALQDQILHQEDRKRAKTPDLAAIFRQQQSFGIKTVYSFQRWDRDQPGIAAIQGADGRFARDSSGKLITIRQLARSGSNLPYFITNGNTPQGIFRIRGIGRSANRFIGPTPNLQLTMPHEGYWNEFFILPADSTDPKWSYAHILPESWQGYAPIYEAFVAGKAGRTEIIAHGTTIDPAYFQGRPFYPISPTLGCLCAEEDWDPHTGRLTSSEQHRLADHFLRAPGIDGYLLVININDVPAPVSPAEIEAIVTRYESGLTATENKKAGSGRNPLP